VHALPRAANKYLTPVYYGRYLGFERPPHLWGGFAEMVYVDLEQLPGTKIYRLPDDMPLRLGALSEPLTSCIRALSRAQRIGGFRVGDSVVIQGSGPIGVLAVAAAQEMGAGRVIVVGAPARPPSRSISGSAPKPLSILTSWKRPSPVSPRCGRSSAATAPTS
jgi:threonine dehydrogenase-like Zn-dependent dehydrogenase